MKLQEIMERTGLKETGLAKAWAKDALHLIRSQTPELIKVDKQNIIDGEQEYVLPADLIQIKSMTIWIISTSKSLQISPMRSF